MIADILRVARKRLGRSLEEIASRASVSASFLNQIEMGTRGVPRKRLEEFANAYNLTKEEKEAISTAIRRRKQGNLFMEVTFSQEVSILNQLLALPSDKRDWVIKTVTDYISLVSGTK